MHALLCNLDNTGEELVLHFPVIFDSFTTLYWSLILHHELIQTDASHEKSAVEKTLLGATGKYGIAGNSSFEDLPAGVRNEIVLSVLKEAKRFVFGALYGDTDESFYEFDVKAEFLKISPAVHRFMCQHRDELFRRNYMGLYEYLAKHNPPEICSKLLRDALSCQISHLKLDIPLEQPSLGKKYTEVTDSHGEAESLLSRILKWLKNVFSRNAV